jgi:hypothetical protein
MGGEEIGDRGPRALGLVEVQIVAGAVDLSGLSRGKLCKHVLDLFRVLRER